MQIADILAVERVALKVKAVSKKAVLEELARLGAGDSSILTPAQAFDGLIARERLGSTGLGNGIAIPHGRIDHLQDMRGTFVRSDAPIDFDAIDGEPVDLFFALFVPENTNEVHLEMLAKLAERFSNADFVAKLRESSTAETVYSLLVDT